MLVVIVVVVLALLVASAMLLVAAAVKLHQVLALFAGGLMFVVGLGLIATSILRDIVGA